MLKDVAFGKLATVFKVSVGGRVMNKVFLVSLSAALIAARLAGAAETVHGTSIDEIEDLVESGNWVELRGFLRERPELTDGDDPFSRELNNFLGQTTSLYSALIIDQVKFPNVKNARIAALSETEQPKVRNLQKPDLKDSDILLEAELAAIKGPPDLNPGEAMIRNEGQRDQDPLLKNITRALEAPENPEQAIEVATLSIEQSDNSFDVSGTQDVAAYQEPDTAVTSARDAPVGPSIY